MAGKRERSDRGGRFFRVPGAAAREVGPLLALPLRNAVAQRNMICRVEDTCLGYLQRGGKGMGYYE